MQVSLKVIFLLFVLFILNNCNTVTGTVEGTVRGVYKDIKTTHHTIQPVYLQKLSVVILI